MRRTHLFIALAPFFMAACSSTPVTPAATAPAAQAPAPMAQAAPRSSTPQAVAPAQPMLAAHLDPNSALSREHSVYFDFDGAVVAPKYTPVIERHGQYLIHHDALKVIVQGNSDERGSAEYNLALGQRRAEAVRSSLHLYGVKDSQIEAVSFGMEKPMAQGHDEAAWAQNRRADITYAK